MNKTTKIIIGVIIIIIIGGIWYGVSRKPAALEEIKIGITTALTGDVAVYGLGMEKGFELALEKINNAGGINGKKIKLIYEDHKCDAKEAGTAINKLINVDKVSIVIDALCSSCLLAESPIAEKTKTVLLGASATNYKIADAGDYIFRIIASDAYQGKEVAKLANKRGYKNVAILNINNDYGVSLKEVFAEEFEKLGGKIVIIESYGQDATDARTQLIKIKGKNPDAIFMPAHGPNIMALILKQTKELDVNVQFFSTEGFKDESVLEAAGGAAEGVILTSPTQNLDEHYQSFKATFMAKYSGEEIPIYADYAYDAVKIVALAIKNAGSVKSDAIKNELYKIKGYRGATGEITFDEKGEVIGKEYSVFVVKNGQFVPLEDF